MWPGRLKSSGPVLRSMNARMVAARSAAEMPVLVPALASTETVKAVPSGVILSAAMMRSPSFSRSASSTTTTNSPRAMAATASSIGANGIVNPLSSRSHQALDVLGHQVDLQVHRGARTLDPESGHGSRVGDQGELEGRVVDPGHGEADTVDGDRALLHH